MNILELLDAVLLSFWSFTDSVLIHFNYSEKSDLIYWYSSNKSLFVFQRRNKFGMRLLK